MKLYLTAVCLLLFFTNSSEKSEYCEIYFGTYITDQGQKWQLDPPRDHIFKFHCIDHADCHELYTFDYNDCDRSKSTVTLCSTDNGNIKLQFTLCATISCIEEKRLSKLSFIEGRYVKLSFNILCP